MPFLAVGNIGVRRSEAAMIFRNRNTGGYIALPHAGLAIHRAGCEEWRYLLSLIRHCQALEWGNYPSLDEWSDIYGSRLIGVGQMLMRYVNTCMPLRYIVTVNAIATCGNTYITDPSRTSTQHPFEAYLSRFFTLVCLPHSFEYSQ
jgi:hypothetical protein